MSSDASDRLHLLREGGDRAPLLFVGGIQGYEPTPEQLSIFAAALDAERPVYSLYVDRALLDREGASIASLSRLGLEAVLGRPERSWVLAGYSIGAMVAYEIAGRLQALGRQVPLYVSIDGPGPKVDFRVVPTWRKVAYRGRRLWNMSARERATSLLSGVQRRLERGKGDAPAPSETVPSPMDVWDRVADVQRAYAPEERYRGPILFVEPEGDCPERGMAERVWRRWSTGGVQLLRTPGSHVHIFNESRALAERLTLALQRIP